MCKVPCETNFEITLLKTSSTIQNSRGDKESPGLTPLPQLKKQCGESFTFIESLADNRMTWIHCTNFSQKPSAFNEFSKKCHSNILKALIISTLITMLLVYVFVFNTFTHSDVGIIQLDMYLPLIKVDCNGDITRDAMGANLSDRILVMILN